MIDFEITRFPIIIVCSPRTGSTALLLHLANKYKLNNFGEIFMGIKDIMHSSSKIKEDILNDRKKYFDLRKKDDPNFVLKIMPKEINAFSSYDNLLQTNCYKIKLFRKSVIDQIASLYIAQHTRKFHNYDNEVHENYDVEINKIDLIDCIESITHSNFLCDKLPYSYDSEIAYEDLQFIPNTYGTTRKSNHTYTHKPNNYVELCDSIRKLIPSEKRE